jgi:two-component system response regulator YesN
MDNIDVEILKNLRCSGRISHEELSKKLNISRPAIHQRGNKMEREGVIEGYITVINWEKLDKTIKAFVNIKVIPTDFQNTVNSKVKTEVETEAKSNVKSENNDFVSLNIKDEVAIKELLKSMNREGIVRYLDTLFEKIVKLNANYKSVQMICAELVGLANTVCKEFGIGDLFINSNESIPYENIKKYDTIEDMKQWIYSTYNRLITLMEHNQVNSALTDYTKKAIEYINMNYNKNISLTDAAKYAGVSMQYLSKLFKEEYRMGFVDYLNKTRIERAKTLIESGDKKLKEIITKVGFNNYNYFFKVFKETAGITPTEYERICK